jgi:hypothetical protein
MTRDETRYIPQYSRAVAGRKPFRSEVIADRKERFAALNKYVTARHGWLTSVPGERDVTMECLPESTLPDELRAGAEFMLGDEKVRLPPYKVIADGEGQRILPHAIVQHFVAGADGEMVPLTAGSTRPVASTVTHAGICKVTRYAFDML